jgi:Zn-dependent peptidase ImmA (M78 family)
MTIIEFAIDFVYHIIGKTNSIDPYFLCEILGIGVIDSYYLEKDGYLICSDGLKLIFVSNKISNRHRKRFVVAHEIGHFLMHREQMYCCSEISVNQPQRVNTPIQEQQANEFASEILLPTNDFIDRLPTDHISFALICKIAKTYDVSVTMAAIKAVKNSKTEEEMLLCYENNRLKWYATGNKEIRPSQVPIKCPMELDVNSNYSSVVGYWEDLYIGAVSQEVFHPFGNQFLVLLSGREWNIYGSH